MAAASSGHAHAYAPFGRRLLALALDSLILAALFAILVVAVNGIAGRSLLAQPWRAAKPISITSETASRTITKEEGGVVRELVTRRETRVYDDGTVRIYVVLDGRVTGANGAPAESSTQRLIGISAGAWYRELAAALLGFALAFGYFAFFEASALQGSPGKRAVGLRVTDLTGARIRPGRALARQVFKCLDVASSGLTYLIAGFTERRQGLHDILAGTLVVRAAPLRAPALSPAPR